MELRRSWGYSAAFCAAAIALVASVAAGQQASDGAVAAEPASDVAPAIEEWRVELSEVASRIQDRLDADPWGEHLLSLRIDDDRTITVFGTQAPGEPLWAAVQEDAGSVVLRFEQSAYSQTGFESFVDDLTQAEEFAGLEMLGADNESFKAVLVGYRSPTTERDLDAARAAAARINSGIEVRFVALPPLAAGSPGTVPLDGDADGLW